MPQITRAGSGLGLVLPGWELRDAARGAQVAERCRQPSSYARDHANRSGNIETGEDLIEVAAGRVVRPLAALLTAEPVLRTTASAPLMPRGIPGPAR